MGKSNLVELDALQLAETANAVLVTIDQGQTKVWLPKSQIEVDLTSAWDSTCTVTLPEWLAIEKGLV